VIKSFAVGSQSIDFLRFSPTTPLNFSEFLTILSSELCSFSHFRAVFGPTFSIPGTLSDFSPIFVN